MYINNTKVQYNLNDFNEFKVLQIQEHTWGLSSEGLVGKIPYVISQTNQRIQDIQVLPHSDVIEIFSILIRDSEFLKKIIEEHMLYLGFNEIEKRQLLQLLASSSITDIIELVENNQGVNSSNTTIFGQVIFRKLPEHVKNSDEFVMTLLQTPGIIEVYPTRTDNIAHLISVLHHEINHILMMILYIFRQDALGVTLQNIISKLLSPEFNSATETLAWLDSVQFLKRSGYKNEGEIYKYVGGKETQMYDASDEYEMAKLRALRIYILQEKIKGLSDTTNEIYTKYCRNIRDFIFAGVDMPFKHKLFDDYLDTYITYPVKARDLFL